MYNGPDIAIAIATLRFEYNHIPHAKCVHLESFKIIRMASWNVC